ncbi:MAG: T9SS type A sorting domain-containing protein [Ignavibacteriaceae bacterium]|nr:T9SS type A sorting domain-containing protein [Ignavibacteriaceae bacterium]
MKKLFFLFTLAILSFNLQAQDSVWSYVQKIHFPPADTAHIQPYLMTMDGNGKLYVTSSKATSLNGKNAIFYLANPTDTVLSKMIDFDANGDSDTLTGNIGAIRGITALNSDIYINANIPFPRFSNTLASQYVYPNADTNLVQKFGFNITGAGYGTYIHGAAITKDTILFTGITFNTSIRFYNFSYGLTTPARGSWVPLNVYPPVPGGPHTNGFDVVRDVAVIPTGDYNNPEIPFYTSRNSLSTTQVTGGVAIWTGGSQTNPEAYSALALSDAARDLDFDRAIPYGIHVDHQGKLWVAGTDSTRRWVKQFDVIVNFAIEAAELPGINNPNNPNPQGAPMTSPSDVVVNASGNIAYVADGGSKYVYKFMKTPPVSVEDADLKPASFDLMQNYPNPFNPQTLISFNLAQGSNIKLFVTNAMGEIVEELYSGFIASGKHNVVFNASNLPSGNYFYTLLTGEGSFTKKMTLLK